MSMVKPWAPEMADVDYAASDYSPEAKRARLRALHVEDWRRRSTGRYGAFTDEEMARAKAALGPNQRDPAADILASVDEPDEADTEEPWLPRWEWNQCQLVDNLARQIQEAQVAIDKRIDALLDRLGR
jgi:hypothetical protein